jgi:hypothetical protein
LLFVDVNKMVSAPFPRSHENGLPRNYLREATKMTMLRMSAKWCSKKRPPPPQRVSVFSFLVFFLHLHFYLIYICKAKAKQKKANESKGKAKKSKAKQTKAVLLFALLWSPFPVLVEITAF